MDTTIDTVCPVVEQSSAQSKVFRAGTIKRIHVNQHIIRENKKTGACHPAITIQWRNKSYRFREVEITGPSEVIYSPDRPLSCGAHIWVETKTEVVGKNEIRTRPDRKIRQTVSA
jgi:hypothetical protein